jgi:aarF domain-containing kinase
VGCSIFFEELDYVNEGENGTYFAEVMKEDLPQNKNRL